MLGSGRKKQTKYQIYFYIVSNNQGTIIRIYTGVSTRVPSIFVGATVVSIWTCFTLLNKENSNDWRQLAYINTAAFRGKLHDQVTWWFGTHTALLNSFINSVGNVYCIINTRSTDWTWGLSVKLNDKQGHIYLACCNRYIWIFLLRIEWLGSQYGHWFHLFQLLYIAAHYHKHRQCRRSQQSHLNNIAIRNRRSIRMNLLKGISVITIDIEGCKEQWLIRKSKGPRLLSDSKVVEHFFAWQGCLVSSRVSNGLRRHGAHMTHMSW